MSVINEALRLFSNLPLAWKSSKTFIYPHYPTSLKECCREIVRAWCLVTNHSLAHVRVYDILYTDKPPCWHGELVIDKGLLELSTWGPLQGLNLNILQAIRDNGLKAIERKFLLRR
jgi:hypothetical protein